MFKRLILAGCLVIPFVTLSGCAVNKASATLMPGTDMAKIKSVYVVKQPKDKYGIDELIKVNLEKRGYIVKKGPESDTAYDADAAITYVDKWTWDITLYLVELTVTVREAKGNFPLATGNSMHTSLTRLAPPEMVDEVLNNILSAPKK